MWAQIGAAAVGGLADAWSKNQQQKKAFSQQKELSRMNFKQQKYFAENAHQMEMQDLKKAGLNPALTATGGSGASASGGGIPGAQNVQAVDILGAMKTLIDAKNQTSATKSQNELNRAQAMKQIADTNNIPFQNKIGMIKAFAAQQQAEAATTNAEANTTNASANYNRLWIDQDKKPYEIKKLEEEARYYKERSRGFYSSNGMNSMFGGVNNARGW